LKLLCRHVLPHQRLSRHVVAGTRQAGNEALPNRIACIHHDRIDEVAACAARVGTALKATITSTLDPAKAAAFADTRAA